MRAFVLLVVLISFCVSSGYAFYGTSNSASYGSQRGASSCGPMPEDTIPLPKPPASKAQMDAYQRAKEPYYEKMAAYVDCKNAEAGIEKKTDKAASGSLVKEMAIGAAKGNLMPGTEKLNGVMKAVPGMPKVGR